MTRGTVVMGIGGLHCGVGLVMAWRPLLDIVADGIVGAVPDDAPWRMAAFWFQLFGLLLGVLGATWHGLERGGRPIPRVSALGLFIVALVGVIVMPVSGFWLVLPVAFSAARTRDG